MSNKEFRVSTLAEIKDDHRRFTKATLLASLNDITARYKAGTLNPVFKLIPVCPACHTIPKADGACLCSDTVEFNGSVFS